MSCSAPKRTAEVGFFVTRSRVLGAGDKGSSVPHTGSGRDATAPEGQSVDKRRWHLCESHSSQRGNSTPAALMGSQLRGSLVSVSHLGSLLSQFFFFPAGAWIVI